MRTRGVVGRYTVGMPGGKKSPALFELIKDARGVAPPVPPRPIAAPGTPATPVVVPAQPETPVSTTPTEPAVVEAAPRQGSAPVEGDRKVAVPLSWLYLAAAGVLLAALLIWVIAWRGGAEREKAKADKQLGLVAGQQTPSVSDPLKTQSGPAPQQIPANSGLVTPRPTQPPTTASQAAADPTKAVSAAFGQDPRQAGFNYLLVEGKLDKDSAQKIHDFLSGQGVPVFAVVDDRGGSGNNPALYLIGVTRGFNRDDLRSRAKGELENRIRALGQQWQSQHRGSTDFSRFFWARH
jgi:hypothetical protein